MGAKKFYWTFRRLKFRVVFFNSGEGHERDQSHRIQVVARIAAPLFLGDTEVCEQRAKVVKTLLDQAIKAAQRGEHLFAITKLTFAIGYQQDQIRDLERRKESAEKVSTEATGRA